MLIMCTRRPGFEDDLRERWLMTVKRETAALFVSVHSSDVSSTETIETAMSANAEETLSWNGAGETRL
jgi:uncharacterized protein CbrC (UPF0167 family)